MKRIALPCEDGQVCAHFGHAPEFRVFDVEPVSATIQSETSLASPPHQPGLLPVWLAEQGVHAVLAGGMGGRARDLLAEQGIDVVVGVESGDARAAVQAYLNGNLAGGDNACDHTGCAH